MTELKKDELSSGRIMTLGVNPWEQPNAGGFPGLYGHTAPYLIMNYPTLWGLYHFSGYEPLVSQYNLEASRAGSQDIEYMRSWGTKWYITKNTVTINDNMGLEEKYKDEYQTIYMDPQAKPLIFWKNAGNDKNIDMSIRTNSIVGKVNTPVNDTITFSFVYNDYFKAYVDNMKTEVSKNEIGQMVVEIPSVQHSVRLVYDDPNLKAGMIVSLSTLLIIIIYIFYIKTKSKAF